MKPYQEIKKINVLEDKNEIEIPNKVVGGFSFWLYFKNDWPS
jgi:hypothetical protein